MILSDEKLKHYYHSYLTEKALQDRRACPSLNKLLSILKKHVRTRTKLKVIDHATSCPFCARELELILGLDKCYGDMMKQFQSTPELSIPHSYPTRIFGHLLPLRLTLLITGIIITISALFFVLHNGSPHEQTRAIRSAINLIHPIHTHIAAQPLVFQWKGMNGAELYMLELYDQALLPIWKSPGSSLTYVMIPDTVALLIKQDQTYHWMVTAYAHGEKIAESEMASFITIGQRER